MATIVYLGDDQALRVADPGMTILDVSIASKIPHFRECGEELNPGSGGLADARRSATI